MSDSQAFPPAPTLVPFPLMTSELGYGAHLIQEDEEGVEVVWRKCLGPCGRRLKFSPQEGVSRPIFCHVCKQLTQWRVVR